MRFELGQEVGYHHTLKLRAMISGPHKIIKVGKRSVQIIVKDKKRTFTTSGTEFGAGTWDRTSITEWTPRLKKQQEVYQHAYKLSVAKNKVQALYDRKLGTITIEQLQEIFNILNKI